MKSTRIYSLLTIIFLSLIFPHLMSAQLQQMKKIFSKKETISMGKNESGMDEKLQSSETGIEISKEPITIKRTIDAAGNYHGYGWRPDTVYYSGVKRDSLWYVGEGKPIPPAQAKKMDGVYRLTMRLPNGQYVHVESLDNCRPKSSPVFESYLLPVESYDYYLEEGTTWLMSQKLITQIYQYPSRNDRYICTEIACDKDGNTVHTVGIEFVSDDRAILTYTDADGDMVNLTDSDKYLNGTIVIADFSNEGVPVLTVADRGGWPVKKL